MAPPYRGAITTMGKANMIDDMQGLYAKASEVYFAGQANGIKLTIDQALCLLGNVSAKHEQAGNIASFRAAEECCQMLVELREIHFPQKTTLTANR